MKSKIAITGAFIGLTLSLGIGEIKNHHLLLGGAALLSFFLNCLLLRFLANHSNGDKI